jgi:hypothetical protein
MVIVEPMATSAQKYQNTNAKKIGIGQAQTCKSVLHVPTAQRVLKLGAHEPVAVSRIFEDHEVDLEHHHVKTHGDDD